MTSPILPIPEILPEDSCVLITKKEHIASGLPLKRLLPPKSPVKQSYALSNSRSCSERVTSVSFREDASSSVLSSLYQSEVEKSYFEQCFTEVAKIGEGAFGIVFQVRSKEDGRYYAVKKSKYPFRSNHDKKLKLEEVRKHEIIPNHPNCIQLYCAWIESNYLYLQMELCGITLESYAAQNHNIKEDFLWNILVDILLALKNLHDMNLIHLDVKLENILLSKNSVWKLGDFGLVSDVNQIELDTLEGDQKYLAPELLRGCFTKAADIFSLGIVMLELSCDLMLPQNGTLWQQLRNDTFPQQLVKDLPKDLYSTIKQMMASDYTKRPTVQELLKIPRIQQILTDRAFPRCLRLILNNYYLAFIYYLKTVTKLPIWLLDRVILRLKDSINTSPPEINLDPNYTSPMANSTPISAPKTQSEQFQDWPICFDVSPINRSEDVGSSASSSSNLNYTEPSELTDSLMIPETERKKRYADEAQTPKRSHKKLRRVNNNHTVGRQLFL